ncbi:MAG: FAD-dependent oxidoreductase [Actinobacteria bacterium]|nr:FAD-dependent oxidoreductase [Actinomycetota bacterium]
MPERGTERGARRETVVIGAGVVGLATARALARAGAAVTLIEAADVLPAAGSSRGDARIRVLAAYPDDEYLELGLRAAERWRELERESGAALLRATGALSYGEGIGELTAALRRFDVPHEELGAGELARRFPAVAPPGSGPVVHQPDGAVIAADRVLEALLASARRAGVEVRERERVVAVEEGGAGAVVETERGRLEADRVAIAAGPWAPALVPWPDLAARLRPSRQVVSYFGWDGPPPPAVIEYGQPDPYAAWSPVHGLKAADHQPGPDADPDDRRAEVDRARVEATAA